MLQKVNSGCKLCLVTREVLLWGLTELVNRKVVTGGSKPGRVTSRVVAAPRRPTPN